METIAYLILTILTLCWCYFASGRDKRVLFIYIPWLIFISILSYFNFFKNTTALPPRFLVAVLPNVFFIWVLVKKTKLNQLNIITLTSLQIIRIPIELFLYAWYLDKTVPISMTFKGLNFDILMGISALFLTIYLLITKKHPKNYFYRGMSSACFSLLTSSPSPSFRHPHPFSNLPSINQTLPSCPFQTPYSQPF